LVNNGRDGFNHLTGVVNWRGNAKLFENDSGFVDQRPGNFGTTDVYANRVHQGPIKKVSENKLSMEFTLPMQPFIRAN
jgi:hypothetical protein